MSNFKIISAETAKSVAIKASTPSGMHVGIGGAYYVDVLNDKIYKDNTVYDVFNNNDIKVNTVLDLMEGDVLKQSKGKKFNSANAVSILQQAQDGDGLEEYYKVIIYFPANLNPSEQIKFRDTISNALTHIDLPTLGLNKNKGKSLVARSYKGSLPHVVGQIHTNQGNEPHFELTLHNRAYDNIVRDANGNITSVETSPILKLKESDIFSSFVTYLEKELSEEGFNQKLNANHKATVMSLKTPQQVQQATNALLAPTQPVTAPTTQPTQPVTAPTTPVVAPTQPVTAPTTQPTQPVTAPTTPVVAPTQPVEQEDDDDIELPEKAEKDKLKAPEKPKSQDLLNEKIRQNLIEQGLDAESVDRTLKAVSTNIDVNLNIGSESGGFKDDSHVSISLDKAKNSTVEEINDLMLAIEAKKKEYEILEVTQSILVKNKELNKEISELNDFTVTLKNEIKKEKELNAKLEEKVTNTVSKNIGLAIDLDKEKSINNRLIIQRKSREIDFDKKLSAKERILANYKSKIKTGFERLNSTINQITIENQSLKTSNESLLADCHDYENQISELNETVKSQELALRNLEIRKNKEILDLKTEHSNNLNNVLTKVADKDIEIANLKLEHQKEIKDAIKLVREEEEAKLNEYKKSVSANNAKVAKGVKEIKETQDQLKKENKELKKTNDDKDDKIAQLLEELSVYKNKPTGPKLK